jgi:hypothetical protein
VGRPAQVRDRASSSLEIIAGKISCFHLTKRDTLTASIPCQGRLH